MDRRIAPVGAVGAAAQGARLTFSPCGRRWPSGARSDEGCCVERNRGDCLRIALYVSHFLRLISSNTPHPSWRFAPIHLLPQGEKGEAHFSVATLRFPPWPL